MDQVILKNVTKHFTTKAFGKVTAVNNVSLNIKEGECFSFLGPSGCGKTTTLRLIAGFEDLSSGEIWFGDKPVSIKDKNYYLPPEDRGLGMVFQAFAVWPHLNVFENVAFPLRIQRVNKTDMAAKVKEALKHTNLSGLEEKFPSELSGGQQQRIALARAIVTNPRFYCWTNPFPTWILSSEKTCVLRSRICREGLTLPLSMSPTTRRKRWHYPTECW